MSDYFPVELTPNAESMLREVGKRYGKKTYETLRDLIIELEFDPELKGEPLRHPLHGLFSLHYSRFRVIYTIDNGKPRVVVVAAGFHASGDRDDIYQIVKRMVENGQLVIKPAEDKKG